ncbi:antitoxin [Glutamicibacter sp.]|uniref:antitoxin n=1 Tax=Glutamicibacter sp. TaxID=1931995 RepID=UPI0028BE9CDF|nr:antitoxin [Glutamicibacter sp.]
MAGFDELKGKVEGLAQQAGDFAGQNSEAISDGIGKAGDFIDEKTGGQYADHVDGIQEGAQNLLDGLGNKDQA